MKKGDKSDIISGSIYLLALIVFFIISNQKAEIAIGSVFTFSFMLFFTRYYYK